MIISHTLDKSSAEDIFQEVFLKLAGRTDSIKDEEHLRYWLVRTAVNMSLSHNRRTAFVRSAAAAPPPCEDGTLLYDLRSLLEDMPLKYRAVIYLCCFEGCTAKETGEILGIPENTVKTRLSRARKKLRKELYGHEQLV